MNDALPSMGGGSSNPPVTAQAAREAVAKRLVEPWERRDGSLARPCWRLQQALGPAVFSPSVFPFALEAADQEALRRCRNQRRGDKKRGRSPRKWP